MAAAVEIEPSNTPSVTPRGIDQIMSDMLGEDIGVGGTDAPCQPEDASGGKYTFSASAQAIIDRLTRMSGMATENADPTPPQTFESSRPTPKPTAYQVVVPDVTASVEPDIPPQESIKNVVISSVPEPPTADPTPIAAVNNQYTCQATTEWVNYQYDRLVAERNNKSSAIHNTTTSYTSKEKSPDTEQQKNSSPMSKSIAEIMKQYSSDPLYKNGSSRNMSRAMEILTSGSGRMNMSQNNETLSSNNSEVDQLRRCGSSVDSADGDCRLKGFHTKSSYSNIGIARSKTSLGSIPSEDKSRPGRVISESNVDRKPNSGANGGEANDFKSDLPNLNMSFLKERERLRQIETLIKKTPSVTFSGMHDYQSWKTGNYFKPRYMPEMSSEYLARKGWSTTDYRPSSDWRGMSPSRSRDILNRTYSSPSYRNIGAAYQPSYSSRYPRDTSPTQYPTGMEDGHSSSVDMTSCAGPTSNTNLTPGSNYPLSTRNSGGYVYREPSATRMNSSTKQYDVKRNRNMSKAVPEGHQPLNVAQKATKSKSSTHTAQRCEKQVTKGKPHQDFNSSRSVEKKSDKSKICRTNPKPKDHGKKPQRVPRKYQPYQPKQTTAMNGYTLKRAQSDLSSGGGLCPAAAAQYAQQLAAYESYRMTYGSNNCASEHNYDYETDHCQQECQNSLNYQLQAVANGLLAKRGANTCDKRERDKSETREYNNSQSCTWSESLLEDPQSTESDIDSASIRNMAQTCFEDQHRCEHSLKEPRTKTKPKKLAIKRKPVSRK